MLVVSSPVSIVRKSVSLDAGCVHAIAVKDRHLAYLTKVLAF
jgi:hypothetical protein